MTVGQFIESLKQCPPDAMILVAADCHDGDTTHDTPSLRWAEVVKSQSKKATGDYLEVFSHEMPEAEHIRAVLIY